MTNTEFVAKLKAIVNLNTLYVNGCFGAPMTETNKQRYLTNTAYNRKPERQQLIKYALACTYGFDCCGLIKSVLWGFKGDNSSYGGAKYCSNNVPDIGEDAMIKLSNPSTDFSKLTTPGAIVWMSGHIGVYIGDGLVIESSPKWKDGVQITCCLNQGSVPGYNGRKWQKWGKLPYLTYEETEMVQKIKVLYNGKTLELDAIVKDGTNYIRLRDFDDKLDLCEVGYDKQKKLPVITPKA